MEITEGSLHLVTEVLQTSVTKKDGINLVLQQLMIDLPTDRSALARASRVQYRDVV